MAEIEAMNPLTPDGGNSHASDGLNTCFVESQHSSHEIVHDKHAKNTAI
jgi:hypothetical protein